MVCIKELGSAQLIIEILQKGSNMSITSELVTTYLQLLMKKYIMK